MTKEEKLAKWDVVSKELVRLKVEEMELRNEVLHDYFDYEGDDRQGTSTVSLGNNHKLKSAFNLYYRLEKNSETKEMLDKLAKVQPDGMFVAQRLIKWKPELSVSEYKQLNAEMKAIVDEVLTTTPGTPSIKIMAPKVKK